MITLQELNPHNYPTTPEIDANLKVLLERINLVRVAWGKPLVVTSGLRSQADQARINPKAPRSHHLRGEAVDLSDASGELKKWLIANPEILVKVELWCEAGTIGWTHFQIVPPASGHRWFRP